MNYLIISVSDGGKLHRYQSPVASDIGAQWESDLQPIANQLDQWALTAQVGDVFESEGFLVVRLNDYVNLP